MLTLTRRSGESIMIGNDIRIVVREIKGNQVRIGIDAPNNVPIWREEIYVKIQDESQDQGQQNQDKDLGVTARLAL